MGWRGDIVAEMDVRREAIKRLLIGIQELSEIIQSKEETAARKAAAHALMLNMERQIDKLQFDNSIYDSML